MGRIHSHIPVTQTPLPHVCIMQRNAAISIIDRRRGGMISTRNGMFPNPSLNFNMTYHLEMHYSLITLSPAEYYQRHRERERVRVK